MVRGRSETSSRSAIRRRTSRALHDRYAEDTAAGASAKGLRSKVTSGGGFVLRRGERENLEEEKSEEGSDRIRERICTWIEASKSNEAARGDIEQSTSATVFATTGRKLLRRRGMAACREKPLNGILEARRASPLIVRRRADGLQPTNDDRAERNETQAGSAARRKAGGGRG